jgi:hypothetical protein
MPLTPRETQDILQDCNINLLVGSGASAPYLSLLGNIETLLTDLESQTLDDEVKKVIRTSIYAKYWDVVISKNIDILEDADTARSTLDAYKSILRCLNTILINRGSSILSRQVNVFTTNIDIFFERALESCGLEFNDGFRGRFAPVFDSTNFRKSYTKKSLFYDNVSEMPVFNLHKLHGSVSWEIEDGRIVFSRNLDILRKLKSISVDPEALITIEHADTIGDLVTKASGKLSNASMEDFLSAYEEMLIVNPTKEKFKLTLLNQTYYELLRLFSNELEKEGTILFVVGFSMADEHIRQIVFRGANSNPTLGVKIFAHTSGAKKAIEETINRENMKFDNVEIISPKVEEKDGVSVDAFEYSLETICERVFGKLPDVADESDTQ